MGDAGQPAGRRALVAEDDHEMRALVVDALRREGFDVDEVADGRRMWLQTIQTPAYDLVVSDVRLPIVDGFTVVEDLRQRRPQAHVIMMTAFGDAPARARAALIGAQLFDSHSR
jgi:DNA-binding response OmpR family regulator